jgi:hypothetical protein
MTQFALRTHQPPATLPADCVQITIRSHSKLIENGTNVPRMLRSAPLLRRGALVIRGRRSQRLALPVTSSSRAGRQPRQIMSCFASFASASRSAASS